MKVALDILKHYAFHEEDEVMWFNIENRISELSLGLASINEDEIDDWDAYVENLR